MSSRDNSDSEQATLNSDANLKLEELRAILSPVPFRCRKYSFMSMFITRVLSVNERETILSPSLTKTKHRTKQPMEILPRIAVPRDLWQQNITIPDAKTKNELLKDINSMLKLFLDSLKTDTRSTINMATLQNFEERFAAANLLHLEDKTMPMSSGTMEDLPEYDLDDDQTVDFPTRANSSHLEPAATTKPKSRSSSFSGSKRVSSLSREFVMGTRKLSLFKSNNNHNSAAMKGSGLPLNSGENEVAFQTPDLSHPPSEGSTYQSAQKLPLSGNPFFKLMIYGKMKPKRELYNLVASAPVSMLSFSSASSRNKFQGLDTKDALSLAFSKSPPNNTHRQIELQRDRLEYYQQIRHLGDNIEDLVRLFGLVRDQAVLITILEFVKDTGFRMFLVDICHMLVARSELEIYRER